MEEQRVQAYAQLIDRLLNCPNGQESEILQQNSELVDEGFFQIASLYAQHLREEGKEQAANFLVDLIHQLSKKTNLPARQDREQEYLQLIQQLLQLPYGEEGKILEANLGLIDYDLIQLMQQIASQLEYRDKIQSNKLINIANNLSQLLDFAQPTPDYFDFILTILKNITREASQQHIYNLFQQNLEKINLQLACTLQIWANENLFRLEPDAQHSIGGDIYKFSKLIEQFPQGDKTINKEIAVVGYGILLNIFAEADFPEAWAMIQLRLGNIYDERTIGKDKDNIELAIASYNAALRVYTETNFSEEWASIQHNLGIIYSNRIAGNKRENVELAIASYHASLRVHNKSCFPQKWASIQFNLGNAQAQRIAGNKRENIELAIASYNAALRVYTEADFSEEWAMVHNQLGAIYTERMIGNREENIEIAINLLNASLQVRNKECFPQQWATTQSNLGLAYRERMIGNRKENIETAIALFTAASKVYTEANLLQQWATTQNNLGIVYRERIAEDKKENIEIAIALFTSALRIYTKADFPQQWAMTHNHLGAVYIDRLAGNKKKNIESAIASFNAALEVFIKTDYPQQWARLQNNLGLAYGDRLEGEKRNNFESAIASFTAALEVFTKTDYPQQWAIVQNNLSLIYTHRIKGETGNNIELAIASFTATLQVCTKEDVFADWGTTQTNLGIAYSKRIVGNEEDNFQSAIDAYTAALTVHTTQSNPFQCLRTASNLGFLYSKKRHWQLAIEAYIVAIEAVEQSREWAVSDRNKQEIISNAIAVYVNIVQACINLGQIDKAIEYVERGKARNLVDLLATKDLYPKGDIPEEIIIRLHTLRQEKIAEEKRLSQQRHLGNTFNSLDSGENRSFTDSLSRNKALDTTRFNRIRQELDTLITEHIQPIDPSFNQNKPISFGQIQSTLPTQQSALIEWFIGDNTLSAFIVTCQEAMPFHFSYTEEQLNILINTVNQYFGTYLKRDRSWQNVLPDLLIQLAENLQIESIVEQIKLLIPDCDRLILVPHRWLHLLPINALPLADGKCLLDLFSQGVSYAPSVQLLQLTQIQNKPQLTNFFAVQNPTGDLDFTNIEVQAVRSQFQPHDDVLAEQQATKSALTKERLRQANLTHFSCHGYFNFENPELSALLLANSRVEKSNEEKDKKEGEIRYLPSRDGGSIDLEQCLTLGEIFSYDLSNCRLVTLSACETGLTDFKSLSDEYIGLPSGFLYAGSPSVVSSLWTVSDISTSFLMIKFYQNLQEIDSVAIALNQAQLWLRGVTKEELQRWKATLNVSSQMWKIDAALINMPDNSSPFASPYYWAAFCAVGS